MTSPMTPHLEKIAREMRDVGTCHTCGIMCLGSEPPSTCTGDCLIYPPTQEHLARAALSALLPPSEEMDRAMRAAIDGYYAGDSLRYDETSRVFTAGINAVLGEPPPA